MKEHVTQGLYDHDRVKICELFDSEAQSIGQAYDLCYVNEINGWQEVSFVLPYYVDGVKNWRWDLIKNERQIRYKDSKKTEWFTINEPKQSHSKKTILSTITCDHLSASLKTKNLYLVFDDTNGIGKIHELASLALASTGWELGECDAFYEADGVTEKERSIKSDGKLGSYQLIQNICNLFNGYPVFDSDKKKVHLYCLNRRNAQRELTIGKNMDSVERIPNSRNIITRLYVEGEYGDFGYVGIDSENPTGLNFLLDFGYYKEIGMFTEKHQEALDKYISDIKVAKDQAMGETNHILESENKLNELWGQIDYVLYVLNSGKIDRVIYGGDAEEGDEVFEEKDVVAVLHEDKTYTLHTINELEAISFAETDTYAIKYITRAAGKIGGKEVAIEAKQEAATDLEKEISKEQNNYSDAQKDEIQKQIVSLYLGMQELYEKEDGLYALVHQAVELVLAAEEYEKNYNEAMEEQRLVELTFVKAMGDMLKDGYWNNENYTVGQEKNLYADAVDVIKDLSRPALSYSVGVVMLESLPGFEQEDFDLSTSVRQYDEELQINDYVYVNKTYTYPENRSKDKVEISNEYQNVQGKSFDSVLSRITQLADIQNVRKSVYDRADVIGGNGSIPALRLEGSIDVLKTQLSSVVSNWYTDNNGNIIFESVDGAGAMKLCGEGFMIANGKTESGAWNWRTFGTGKGFTADAITTGFLSADRIEARSISAAKLDGSVGAQIDLSENAITQTVGEVKKSVDGKADREWVTSQITQTSEEITHTFQTTQEQVVSVDNNLQNFITTVTSYQTFSADGQTLGQEGSPFQAKLSKDRLSFLENGEEVAYISNRKQHITDARVTQKMSVGTEDNGYFDWITTSTGQALKWRG